MYKYNIINSNNNMLCIITYWNHVFYNLKMEFLLPSEKPCNRGRSCMICCIRIFMRLRLDTVFQDHKCFLFIYFSLFFPWMSIFWRCLSPKLYWSRWMFYQRETGWLIEIVGPDRDQSSMLLT